MYALPLRRIRHVKSQFLAITAYGASLESSRRTHTSQALVKTREIKGNIGSQDDFTVVAVHCLGVRHLFGLAQQLGLVHCGRHFGLKPILGRLVLVVGIGLHVRMTTWHTYLRLCTVYSVHVSQACNVNLKAITRTHKLQPWGTLEGRGVPLGESHNLLDPLPELRKTCGKEFGRVLGWLWDSFGRALGMVRTKHFLPLQGFDSSARDLGSGKALGGLCSGFCRSGIRAHCIQDHRFRLSFRDVDLR